MPSLISHWAKASFFLFLFLFFIVLFPFHSIHHGSISNCESTKPKLIHNHVKCIIFLRWCMPLKMPSNLQATNIRMKMSIATSMQLALWLSIDYHMTPPTYPTKLCGKRCLWNSRPLNNFLTKEKLTNCPFWQVSWQIRLTTCMRIVSIINSIFLVYIVCYIE